MAGNYTVAVEGLENLKSISDLPQDILLAATRAINKTTDRTRAESARLMRLQVNFPARYLSGQDGHLRISQRATTGKLEGKILGRHRATSLARFSSGSIGGNPKSGVTVSVKPGSSRVMRRAFLMKLRAGTDSIDTRSNLGLAIRLRPGETIHNKRNMVKVKTGLYLLYGPSVDQVFRSVADDVAPGAADFLEGEFTRLIDLDLK